MRQWATGHTIIELLSRFFYESRAAQPLPRATLAQEAGSNRIDNR